LYEFAFRIPGTADKITAGLGGKSLGQEFAALRASTQFFLAFFDMFTGGKTGTADKVLPGFRGISLDQGFAALGTQFFQDLVLADPFIV
jgi:hypothetical protein